MNYWELQAYHGSQALKSYYCRCEEDPINLLYTDEYKDLLEVIIDELAADFSDQWIDSVKHLTENGDLNESYFEEVEHWKKGIVFSSEEVIQLADDEVYLFDEGDDLDEY